MSKRSLKSKNRIIEGSRFRRCLTASLLLHLSLLFMLGFHGCGKGGGGNDPKKGKSGQENNEKISEKTVKTEPKEIEITIVHLPKESPKPKPKAKHSDVECPSGQFYGGLGIYDAFVTAEGHAIVQQAVKGYPGAEIGLEYRDEILSPNANQIIGEVGTEIALTVRKFDSGKVLNFNVIRDKICTEEGRRP